MTSDAFLTTISEIIPHPNAERLEIARIKGFTCVVGKGLYAPGDKVVYVAPDACIDTEQSWLDPDVAKYLAKGGRVRTVKLRGKMSEGLIISPDVFSEEQLDAIREDNLEAVGITHYTPPATCSSLGKMNPRSPSLPFGLFKTDQANVQAIENSVLFGKSFAITKKMDGTSCTIACKISRAPIEGCYDTYVMEEENGVVETYYMDLHICSRNLDLKLDGDNVYTKTILSMWPELKELLIRSHSEFLDADAIFVFRGEICGTGINASKVNKDAEGDPAFHIFEAYVLHGETLEPWTYNYNVFEDMHKNFGILKPCQLFGYTTITEENCEEVLNEYLDAPADKYGEGVVFWEIDPIMPLCLSGWSFKVKSKDYYSKL